MLPSQRAASRCARHARCKRARKQRHASLLPASIWNGGAYLHELAVNQIEVLEFHGNSAVRKADRNRDPVLENTALAGREPGRVGECDAELSDPAAALLSLLYGF